MTRLRMARPVWAKVGAVLALATSMFTAEVQAQDQHQHPHPHPHPHLDHLAADYGVELPQGYWDRLASDPDAFQLSGAPWRGLSPGPVAVSGNRVADPVSGEYPLLVLLGLFNDSAEPVHSRDDLQAVLFDGPAANGTMTDFFAEASRGYLEVVGQVLDWVRSPLTREAVVGANFGLGNDAQVGEYLVDIIQMNDPLIDYGLYDSDGPDGVPNSGDDDGFVDVITFEFQEVAASCGGDGIWPHRWQVQEWFPDGTGFIESSDASANGGFIKLRDYIIQSASDCTGSGIQSAGVISHEFGHALGLPDFYHPIDGIQPFQRRWVLGCWGIMAGGSWGCGDGSTRGDLFGPTHFAPWSKDFLGWVQWIDVGAIFEEEVFEIGPAAETGEALRIALDNEGREYLVVEYRPQVGFDAALPAGGVMIYHWDMDGELRPERNSGRSYLFSVEEADGRSDLRLTHDNGGNRGEASDAWATEGRAGPLDSQSSPGTRRNALDLPSSVVIHDIEIVGDVARVGITTRSAPRLAGSPTLPGTTLQRGYFASVPLAGGAPPYSASVVGEGYGVTAFAVGTSLRFAGAATEVGELTISAEVEESFGVSSVLEFTLNVGAFVMDQARALAAFVGGVGTPLESGEEQVMDERGNNNGEYDIGDLRAYLYGWGN